MDIKKKLIDRIEKSASNNNHILRGEARHSKAYHKYFEGYVERMEYTDGKERVVRVYVDPYNVQQLTNVQAVAVRAGYVLLLLISFGLFLVASVRRLGGSYAWIAFLPQAFVPLGYLWVLFGLICYLMAGRRMTIHDYRSSSRSLLKSTPITASVIVLAGVVEAVYGLFTTFNTVVLANTLLLLLSGAVMISIYLIERSVKYLTEENEARIKPGDIQID